MISNNHKYIGFATVVYAAALLYLHFSFQVPFSDFYKVLFIVGLGFSALALLLLKNSPGNYIKPIFNNEKWLLLGLIVWIAFYITYGGSLINRILPPQWINNQQAAGIAIFIKKLLFFVLLPFLLYWSAGFTLTDFGLRKGLKEFSGKNIITAFLLLSTAILLFQYFYGGGSKPIRSGLFSSSQLLKGLPLCYVYLILDAGLIEEFFFRGLLQSRLSLLLKSTAGGIVCTALIFGLVHAPGLFLRGAASEGMEEQMPFSFWAAYTIAYMSVAGVFLGIVYQKTKNLWLCIFLHAMFDLLPNLPDFINTWHL